MMFENRLHAAKLLTQALIRYRDQDPIVLAIPRGAVPMARLIADGLQGELSCVLVHKIPAPENPEFAIGSIGLSGNVYLNPDLTFLRTPEIYLQHEAEHQLRILKERAKSYGLGATPPDYHGRTVIIVDDGIATGATALAAIREVRSHDPQKVVVAAAVAPPDTAAKLRAEADEVVLLDEPDYFYAVGQFFEDFPQVSDEEVIRILRAAWPPRPRGPSPRPENRGRP